MAKLDRLGWAADLSFEAFGVIIGIRTNDRNLLKVLLPYLPSPRKPLSRPAVDKLYSMIGGGLSVQRNIRRFHLLYGNVQMLARSAELSDVLDILRSDMNFYVAENAARRLFVHAGTVGWKGRAIVIPGASLSGKTTLVQEFLRAGATYYSDEFAVLDGQGFLHPFAAALSVRRENSDRQEMRPPTEFSDAIGARSLPIGCVLATTYRPGARWRFKAVTKGQGVFALLANTVAARKDPFTTLSTLSSAVARAEIFKSERGEAKDMVDEVLKYLAQRPFGGTN
jgi:hypothetical protein